LIIGADMSLKQFPASQSTAAKTRKVLPPPMNATLFDPIRAWDVINKRKDNEYVDVGGLGGVEQSAAKQIANAAGIRIRFQKQSMSSVEINFVK
jgi:hypothetical protein